MFFLFKVFILAKCGAQSWIPAKLKKNKKKRYSKKISFLKVIFQLINPMYFFFNPEFCKSKITEPEETILFLKYSQRHL